MSKSYTNPSKLEVFDYLFIYLFILVTNKKHLRKSGYGTL